MSRKIFFLTNCFNTIGFICAEFQSFITSEQTILLEHFSVSLKFDIMDYMQSPLGVQPSQNSSEREVK